MIKLIDTDFNKPIEFDPGVPVELVQITNKGISRVKVQLNRCTDLRPDHPMISTPITFSSDYSYLVAPNSLPACRVIKSNRRLKRGFIVLKIPDGFIPGYIEYICKKPYLVNESSRMICNVPDEIHLKNVVGGIIKRGCDRFRKSSITFLLRNKKMNANDIENVLDFLVERGDLQELDNIDAPNPVAGRKPSQEYLVLWDKKILPAKPS